MNSNLYGKYSTFSGKSGSGKNMKKKESTKELINNEYKQLHRSKLVEISRDNPKPTLEEKIQAKVSGAKKESKIKEKSRVEVEILGRNYFIGSRDGLSEAKIKKIAEFANDLLIKTTSDNPGLIESRAAILALLDCAERYIQLEEKYNNMRVDYLYYQQKEEENLQTNPIEDTPMQDFINTKGNTDDEQN